MLFLSLSCTDMEPTPCVSTDSTCMATGIEWCVCVCVCARARVRVCTNVDTGIELHVHACV